MPRNLELKASIASIEEAHASARACGARFEGILEQQDTYFSVPRGRLKLRERRGGPAELISYLRPETNGERWSEYTTLPVSDPATTGLMLRQVLEVKIVVTKVRHLYMHEGARIHIDEVEKLGTFIEFEVPDRGDARAAAHMKVLRRVFDVHEENVIKASYSEMLEAERISSGT
jgi:adenylate cyclase class 2